MAENLLTLSHVDHAYTLPSGKVLPVLSEINLTIRSGALVALLGPSGCGKSTLIRIASGLLRPTKGKASYREQLIGGPDPRIALVFQQFALFPWLTVAQNIEQVLLPRGIDPKARIQRVAEVISLIGLDGFEEAYPREISGGMKQRVGIARALAVQPELLCMDEAFSNVDALTAETLRNEVVSLWRDRDSHLKSICLVSHDIQEVAFMANQILVMSANPGRISTIIENPLPYPRNPDSEDYKSLVRHLHAIITGLVLPEEGQPTPVRAPMGFESMQGIVSFPLAEVREMIGLLEVIEDRGGSVSLFTLTEEMDRDFTRILLASKAAELFGFLKTPEEQLVLTPLGRQFITASRKLRKQIFRQYVTQLPLIKHIQKMLSHHPQHSLNKDILLEELAIQCPQEDPKKLFRILMNWGRFADLWAYKSATGTLVSLEAAAAGEI